MFSGRPPDVCGGPVYFFARYPHHVEARRKGRENRLAAEAAATDKAVCQQGEAPAGVSSHPEFMFARERVKKVLCVSKLLNQRRK
jgi:hypothetical protein